MGQGDLDIHVTITSTDALVQPTVDDVAREMPTRTVPDSRDLDVDPTEGGTFTAETRPTAEQASGGIEQALALLRPRLGTVPERLVDTARRAVVLRTAMLLERRFWPEEVDDDRGVYTTLRDELDEVLKAYDLTLAQDTPGQARSRQTSLRVRTLLSEL